MFQAFSMNYRWYKISKSQMRMYSTDWESVVKTIYNYETFGPELNKTGYYEDDLKVLLAGKNTPEEKILGNFESCESKCKMERLYRLRL